MRALIGLAARNPVAANVLMVAFILGGFLSGAHIKQEIFPDIELDVIEVSVGYYGAGPEDIEEGIILQVEDAIRGIDGIREIRSVAREGVGQVFIEVDPDRDANQVLQDVKNAVDRIVTFPDNAERPVIKRLLRRRQVISLSLYGDASEASLRFWAERIRDRLLHSGYISQVELEGTSTHEIAIHVPEINLRRYGLTLDEIARTVRESSQDIPAGAIRTYDQKIQVRVKGRRYFAREFKDITILTREFGMVPLAQIARIEESFRNSDVIARFDSKPAIIIDIYRTGDERPTDISEITRRTVEEFASILPSTMKIAIWKDRSSMLRERIDLLLRNAFVGLLLVMVVLGLFLEFRLAMWVMLGMPVSFLGAMIFMPFMDVSINMISLFAFIMALGIVVDDAIVVGENVFERRKRGESSLYAAINGTVQVIGPVILSVATSILAFLPLLFIEGSTGKFIGVIPKIVITILVISLFECLFILPCHLASSGGISHSRMRGIPLFFTAIRLGLDRYLKSFIEKRYSTMLDWLLTNRYLSISVAFSILLLVFGAIGGGLVKFHFMPRIEADTIRVTVKMLPGTGAAMTQQIAHYIESLAIDAVKHFEQSSPGLMRHIYTAVGVPSQDTARISLVLAPVSVRKVSSANVSMYWRSLVPRIPGVQYVTFQNNLMKMGENIHIRLMAKDFTVLEKASSEVVATLKNYSGVLDVSADIEKGQREIRLRLRPEARALGFTESSLGRQIRGAFYGAEAYRTMRGENEVWIMVKLPKREQSMLASLYNLRVKAPSGMLVPIRKMVEIEEIKTLDVINRVDRHRVVDVTASVDETRANAKEIMDELKTGLLDRLQKEFPGLLVKFEGESRRSSETMDSMKRGFLMALFAMYVLLSIPFKDYCLPLIIMLAIPLGIVGAVLGHMLLGYDLSIMSLFGMVALSGVVVNDSLLLLDYVRVLRAKGMSAFDAAFIASKRRFRPIILTSLTTFFGLAPMLLETSLHAKFLIPMAISLAFGIMFATFVTLLIIPSVYLVFEDFGVWLRGDSMQESASKENVKK